MLRPQGNPLDRIAWLLGFKTLLCSQINVNLLAYVSLNNSSGFHECLKNGFSVLSMVTLNRLLSNRNILIMSLIENSKRFEPGGVFSIICLQALNWG